jgi:16S rRNA (cytosine967-C5)-methyltransferase
MKPVRVAAVEALVLVDRGARTLTAALERFRTQIPDARDRALLTEIVTGSERWRSVLDARIRAASALRTGALSPIVVAALRSGAYQLLFLDRVPAHAALNETVEAVKALGESRAAGLVNAVLRRLSREDRRSTRPLPARPDARGSRVAALDYLSVTLSHPRWLVERWLNRLGFEATERWCQYNNSPGVVTVRPTTPEAERALAGSAPARFAPGAFALSPGDLAALDMESRAGLAVQDEGAQLVAFACGVRPGMTVLDLCAAPGGKAAVLAEQVGSSGRLVAGDFRSGRVALLARTVRSRRIPATIVRLDARGPLPFRASFDRVLVDAPCSGLGTLRRDPDLKWRVAPDSFDLLASAQRSMLLAGAAAVRPGGWLIYATCSTEPEENGAVVDAFLAQQPAFARRAVEFPEAAARGLLDESGALSTLPPRDAIDGYFAAVLERRTL